MAGLAVCLSAGKRGGRSPKSWFGCQTVLRNLSCWTWVTCMSSKFHNHHHSCESGVDEDTWTQEENLQNQVIANSWVSSGNQQGSLSVSTHTCLSPGSLHALPGVWQRVSQSSDPFTSQLVQTCGTRLLLSRAPSFRSQLLWLCLWNPPQPTYI